MTFWLNMTRAAFGMWRMKRLAAQLAAANDRSDWPLADCLTARARLVGHRTGRLLDRCEATIGRNLA